VKRAFELIDTGGCSPDELRDALFAEGLHRTAETRYFSRRQLKRILRDRAYIGEVRYKDRWYPGEQERPVDPEVFDRVQVKLGAAGW
jgi:hypothetical protein